MEEGKIDLNLAERKHFNSFISLKCGSKPYFGIQINYITHKELHWV